MGSVNFSGGSPSGEGVENDGVLHAPNEGVTPEATPAVEQTGGKQPQPSAVDDMGVPWMNRAKESDRKLAKETEWGARYREQAETERKRADEIEQRFQMMVNQQVSAAPVATPDLASINPALASGRTNPLSATPQQPQPQNDPRVDNLILERYRDNFVSEVKNVTDDYGALAQPGTEFNREVDFEFGRVEREYAARGQNPPLGTLRGIADSVYGRMVRQHEIDPNAAVNLNGPTAMSPPSVPAAPVNGGVTRNNGLPEAVLRVARQAGLEPEELIKRIKANPNRYTGSIDAIEQLGGKIDW